MFRYRNLRSTNLNLHNFHKIPYSRFSRYTEILQAIYIIYYTIQLLFIWQNCFNSRLFMKKCLQSLHQRVLHKRHIHKLFITFAYQLFLWLNLKKVLENLLKFMVGRFQCVEFLKHYLLKWHCTIDRDWRMDWLCVQGFFGQYLAWGVVVGNFVCFVEQPFFKLLVKWTFIVWCNSVCNS